MQLTQSEMIQILRKRAGLNQAELGARAFKTTLDSGRTKIKNIELGKQRVSDDDLRRIAQCLEVPVQQLRPPPGGKTIDAAPFKEGILLSQKVVDLFPELQEYLEMLEKAAVIDDYDLIEYLSKKIAGIWQNGPKTDASSSKKNRQNQIRKV
ncbi:MAG: helix-turn-helix transcriptional regulator [Deltaproteobacteria bacterium]|jgi:transcriptional regulator with XRE-family HTH domain|nr:helix-turn-helix transcriptional regulator [Deltaproteobacteria bacterium]